MLRLGLRDGAAQNGLMALFGRCNLCPIWYVTLHELVRRRSGPTRRHLLFVSLALRPQGEAINTYIHPLGLAR
jgi:hypothetical protein